MKWVRSKFLVQDWQFQRWWNWRSLQGRLTLSWAAFMAVTLGGVTVWTAWHMRQMLVHRHKIEMVIVVRQLHEDVETYLDMFSPQESLQRALEKRAKTEVFMWATDENQTVIAKTPNFRELNRSPMGDPRVLATMVKPRWAPDIYRVRDRDVVACHQVLVVKAQSLGNLYLARDITEDQRRFYNMLQALFLATGLAILVTPVIMGWAIQRWLRPLNQMGVMTKRISLEAIDPAPVELEAAPIELQEVVEQFNGMMARWSHAWREQREVGERQRQFLSNISHELRTPLTIVRGYLQSTLRRSDNLSAPQREGLEIAATEADQTIQLLQDMLSLARAEDGHIPYDLKPLVLNDVVADVVHMAEQFSRRTVLVEASAPLIPVVADASRLQQVLVNLVENAFKYSDASEPVTLKLLQADNQVMIQVCDRGQGIPLKHQSRIFERFYRVDEARTRSTGGTGLGLSIVKTFVEGMGGQVNVMSKPGEGSTFTVTLPANVRSS